MRIEQLYYLSEVARNRSITLTSERIFVSQPNISESLKSLESELGVTLFRRSRQGIQLTEFGEKTVQVANQVLALIQNLKTDVQNSKITKPLTGSLIIYSVPSMNQTILPEAITLLYKKHPDVNITIIESGLKEIIYDIEEGKGDLGLIVTTVQLLKEKDYKIKTSDLYYEHLAKEKIYTLVGVNSPLSNKKFISLNELANHNLVVHDVFEWVFESLKTPNILLKSTNIKLCYKIVGESKGIGFASNLILNNLDFIDRSKIKVIPLKEDINYSLGIITRKELRHNELVQEFSTIFKTLL